MLQIFNPTDKLPVSSIMAVIYGDAGIGKTSLACQVEDGLLLDFEGGANRAVMRTATAPIEQWNDVVTFVTSGEAKKQGIKTLIVDTVGTMLDRQLTAHLIKEDSKNGNSNGLALKGYGAMKKTFDRFVNSMKAEGINCIFIAHKEQFSDGDDVKYRPKMTGGSYDILIAVADLVGYYEMKGGRRVLNFNPTDRSVGKNTAEFEQIDIPAYTDPSFKGFMQTKIEETAERMASLSQEQQKALALMEEIRKMIKKASMDDGESILEAIKPLEKIHQITTKKLLTDRMIELWNKKVEVAESTDDCDMLYADIESYPTVFTKPLQTVLWNKAKALGYEYDRKSTSFIDPKAGQGEEATETAKEEATSDQEQK